jgi:hypothetical protein
MALLLLDSGADPSIVAVSRDPTLLPEFSMPIKYKLACDGLGGTSELALGTPLHRSATTAAASRDDSKILRMLMKAGPDVHAAGSIEEAAQSGFWSTVCVLIEAGADVQRLLEYEEYVPALVHSVVSSGHDDMLRILIRTGVNLNAPGCIQEAPRARHWSTVRLLLEAGVDVHSPTAQLKALPSLIGAATAAGAESMVQVFLDLGLGKVCPSEARKVPLAEISGHVAVEAASPGYAVYNPADHGPLNMWYNIHSRFHIVGPTRTRTPSPPHEPLFISPSARRVHIAVSRDGSREVMAKGHDLAEGSHNARHQGVTRAYDQTNPSETNEVRSSNEK